MSTPVITQFSKLPEGQFRTPLVDTKTGLVLAGGVWAKWFQILGTPAVTIADTHANRAKYVAANYPTGSTYRETDRGATYIAIGANWLYAYGVMAAAQAALPGDLGINDAGFLVDVTDYGHLLQWTGSGWTWGPGENGSDYYVTFRTAPTDPNTGLTVSGWHAADGSANVPRLLSNGNLGFATIATIAGSYYRQ